MLVVDTGAKSTKGTPEGGDAVEYIIILSTDIEGIGLAVVFMLLFAHSNPILTLGLLLALVGNAINDDAIHSPNPAAPQFEVGLLDKSN